MKPDESIYFRTDNKMSRPEFSNLNLVRSFRRHGGMKYYVLWLLSSKAMKGSELMDEIQKQSMGWWRPSPGTIYPLLNNMEKDGFVHRLNDLKYSITEKGLSEIGISKDGKTRDDDENWTAAKVLSEMEGYVSYLEEISSEVSLHKESIENIINRLTRLIDPLNKRKRKVGNGKHH